LAQAHHDAKMPTAIDTEWFVDRLEQRQLSQRGLARLMGIDPAAVSLMFRGKRRITLEEAAQLAVLLDVSTTEVLQRAGLPTHGERTVKVAGFITKDYEVMLQAEGAHDMVEAPSNVPQDTIALQARTTGTDMELIDGYLYFIAGSRRSPSEALGQLAMCAVKGNGTKVGHLKRGYRRGTYNLVNARGDILTNVELAWASPVLWVKTIAG